MISRNRFTNNPLNDSGEPLKRHIILKICTIMLQKKEICNIMLQKKRMNQNTGM